MLESTVFTHFRAARLIADWHPSDWHAHGFAEPELPIISSHQKLGTTEFGSCDMQDVQRAAKEFGCVESSKVGGACPDGWPVDRDCSEHAGAESSRGDAEGGGVLFPGVGLMESRWRPSPFVEQTGFRIRRCRVSRALQCRNRLWTCWKNQSRSA